MNFFGGRDETVHLEQGESYGIPKRVYEYLAQAAISASELCGVEPELLDRLVENRPGAICTLFGRILVYWIGIDMAESPPQLTLSAGMLDSPPPYTCCFIGNAAEYASWVELVGILVHLERVVDGPSDLFADDTVNPWL